MPLYAYSTMSSDVNYSTDAGKVLIVGKANVANANFITPRGMATAISDEQYAALKNSRVFQAHEANGFIVVEKHKEDAEKVAASMQGRDKSAQDSAESLEAEGAAVPADSETTKKRK